MTVLPNLPSAQAAKVGACDVNATPVGVEVDPSNSKVWVASTGGTIQQYLGLNTCTNSSHTVGGDPHFIDVASGTTKIDYTFHSTNDRSIGYYNPSDSTKITCDEGSSSSNNGPDDVDSYSSTSQYFTTYTNGKVVKSVKGTSSCTFTSYTVPGTTPNPEGIDKSTDVSGFFVVDQLNKKLYKMTSGGSFTLCSTFADIPWFVAASDANDLLAVTLTKSDQTQGWVKIIGTLTCAVAETSPANTDLPYDIAMRSNGEPIVTFKNAPKVTKYSYSTHNWVTAHNWSTDCGSGCVGFGIDVNTGTNQYYAAMSGTNNKLVRGTF